VDFEELTFAENLNAEHIPAQFKRTRHATPPLDARGGVRGRGRPRGSRGRGGVHVRRLDFPRQQRLGRRGAAAAAAAAGASAAADAADAERADEGLPDMDVGDGDMPDDGVLLDGVFVPVPIVAIVDPNLGQRVCDKLVVPVARHVAHTFSIFVGEEQLPIARNSSGNNWHQVLAHVVEDRDSFICLTCSLRNKPTFDTALSSDSFGE